uniref:Uncharacterized protein n=1 Tax=Rhizophora mucronata TaxID=61149 RepID=A0A2P2K8D4_RHIMU
MINSFQVFNCPIICRSFDIRLLKSHAIY